MRILTLAMPTPDSRAAIHVLPDGSGIDTRGLKFVCNPFDEFAVEQAVRLKECGSVEEVVALTAGGDDAVQVLRVALAMGADRGLHISDDELPVHDEVRMARIMSAAIRRDAHDFDLILCGKQAIDNDSGELGPALAEFLDLPHIGAVTRLELAATGETISAHRRIEGAEEILETALPALLTCEKGLVEPRYPSLPNLMKAKKKPVQTLTRDELPELVDARAAIRFVKMTPPPPRPPCRLVDGEASEMARELVRLLHEEAKVV